MRRTVLALLTLCASVAGPPAAEAYVSNGEGFWRERIVTFGDRTAGAYGGAARMGVAAWNASGMRLILVPAPWDRALIRIRTVRRGSEGIFGCTGTAGGTRTVPGPGGGLGAADVRVTRGCRDRVLFQQITAHELGHAIGLGHENRRCSTMVSDNGRGARRCGRLWHVRCRVLQADDVRGAVRFYGGRARGVRSTMRAACGDRAPGGAGALAVDPDPAGSVATARIRVGGGGGVAVIVGRRRGACPASPVDPRGTFFYAPAAATVVPAFAEQAPPGRFCYRSWRVSRGGRWSRPRTRTVVHGARTPPARIGLAVAGGHVTFTHPSAPAGWRFAVERRTGTCAAPGAGGTIWFGSLVRGRHEDVADAVAPGAYCYRVVLHDGGYPIEQPELVAALDYQAV